MVNDLGGQFKGAFTVILELWHATPSIRPTEAPWQQALSELRGAALGDADRMVVEERAAVAPVEMWRLCFSTRVCAQPQPT